MHYPARLRFDGEDWLVLFRDIEGAFTFSPAKERALAKAPVNLLRAIGRHVEERRPVPTPSARRRGDMLVSVPASTWVKVLLLNEMLAQQVRPSELARRMGTSAQEMNRIVDLGHATKVDTVAKALQVLGKRLQIGLA